MQREFLLFGIMQGIYQGSGSISMIPNILKKENWKKVLLVLDPALHQSGALDPIKNLVKGSGVESVVFDNVRPNPEAETIDSQAIPLANDFKPDVILTVGGGSTIDTAKGIALVGDSGKKVMEFIGISPTEKLLHKTYPMIAVPTTAGTGSDVCRNAVISDENGYKLVPIHDSILPRYAVLDPDLLSGLPFSIAAATSIDTLTHALETYTNTNANDFTELFSLRALELVGESIREFVANPAVKEYANKMSLACMYSGFSLGIASIGQAHVITHPMGEEPFDMPHGDACGMALPAVIEWNGLGCKYKYWKAFCALTKKEIPESKFEVKMLIDWVLKLNRDLKIGKGKNFEEWGYSGKDVLEKMIEHPIFNNKDKTPNTECKYPRVTKIQDFISIIDRVNYYSKVTQGEIPYEFY